MNRLQPLVGVGLALLSWSYTATAALQIAAGQPVGHDGLGRRWQACRVERFAQGDKAARKSLRRDIAAYLDQLKRDNETHPSASEGA